MDPYFNTTDSLFFIFYFFGHSWTNDKAQKLGLNRDVLEKPDLIVSEEKSLD